MKLQNKSRLISLAAIFICALTAQVQAGFFDDLKNKASSAAKQVVNETVEEVVGKNPSSLPEDTVEEPGKEPSPSDQDKPKETVNTNGKSSGQLETVSKKDSVPVPANSQPAPIARFKTGTSNGDLEITGLRLGMSPSQVEAKLKSYNKDFKFRYINKELHGHSREHQSIHKDHTVIANTKYVSELFASNDGSTAYSPAKRGEWFVMTFAAPPSPNKLIHIRRVKGFLDKGPTTTAYNQAFIDKYGDIYFAQGFDKVVRLISEKPINDSDNKRCFYSIGKSLGHARLHTYDRRGHKNSGCGLILASSHEHLDFSKKMIQKISMELADIDEMNDVADKTRKFIEDNNQKIKDARLKEASKNKADIF